MPAVLARNNGLLEQVERTDYNTDDEVEFLFGLADKGNYAALHTLQKVYKARSWEGEEMNVDPKRVLYMINWILERRFHV